MINSAPQGRNLVGIIPLAGYKSHFDFPWPDYMQPLREGFLAFERSVYECAYAGCDSIWIVCNDDTAPLVKHRIGDYIMSPRYFEEKDFVKRKDYHEKWIPIYYTPLGQKDRSKRDSISWSILHGALTAFTVSNNMSRWIRPTKYFVSFPYGIYNASIVRGERDAIRGPSSFYLSHAGKTVKEGKFLAFTFFPKDWLEFKKNMKEQLYKRKINFSQSEHAQTESEILSSAFGMEKLKIDQTQEIEEYYELSSWESLKSYYGSDIKIPRPSKKFIKPYFLKEKDEHETP